MKLGSGRAWGTKGAHDLCVIPEKDRLLPGVLEGLRSHCRDGSGYRMAREEYRKSPASIVCHAVRDVHFRRCTFTRLGSGGLDLECGAQDNVVGGRHFYDLSGTAIQVGDTRQWIINKNQNESDPNGTLCCAQHKVPFE